MLLINDDLEYSVFLPRSELTFKWLDSHCPGWSLEHDEYDPEECFVTFQSSEEALTAAESLIVFKNYLVH
jgi:hypothetical protein